MTETFRNTVSDSDQEYLLRLLSHIAKGKAPEDVLVFETIRSSPQDEVISGSLEWKNRAHSFSISVSSGEMLSLQSWDETTRHVLAPINAIIADATRKGKSAYLLEKWDDLSQRSDVSALLRRFDREHFLNPHTDATMALRDRVASLGFEIVSREHAAQIRGNLEGHIKPAFKSCRSA